MRYRLLGHSGLRVSEFALGTMTFGDDLGWGAAKDESRRIFDAFREAGGNFIDTGQHLHRRHQREFLGEFLAGQRQSVVLATKYTQFAARQPIPTRRATTARACFKPCEASLRRLRTDYIDLYWMHVWDQLTPVEEVMRGLDDLIRQGKVLYVGVSNAPAWWIAQANTIAALRGWSPFVGLQIEYSLVERTAERELLPMCRALGLGVTAWSPLAGGVLSGKYQTAEGASRGLPMRSCGNSCPSRNGPSGRGCRAANRGRPNWPVPGPSVRWPGCVTVRSPSSPSSAPGSLRNCRTTWPVLNCPCRPNRFASWTMPRASKWEFRTIFMLAQGCKSWPTAACAIGSSLDLEYGEAPEVLDR